jgi:beta-galactosidase
MVSAENYKENETPVIPGFENAVPYQVGGLDAAHQKTGYIWFQAQVPVNDGRRPLFFNFSGLAENAIVFVNSKQVAKQGQRSKPLIVAYDSSGNPSSPVTISILAKTKPAGSNRNIFGDISRPVEIIYNDDQLLTGWSMKGGPGDINAPNGWEPLKSTEQFDRPYFFRNTFTINNSSPQRHPMWRVTFQGLSHGFIFVNGHNLGGYPERVPINSLYIPECWLKKGKNTIVIYDEYGNHPDKVEIQPEIIASRDTRTVNL